jgi:hypothetical protein
MAVTEGSYIKLLQFIDDLCEQRRLVSSSRKNLLPRQWYDIKSFIIINMISNATK